MEAKKKRCRQAVTTSVTMQSSCYLITFENMKQMKSLQSHEIARDSGWLTVIDTYDDLVDLVNAKPVVFFSHQWHSWHHPDPDQLQYNQMIAACETICIDKGFAPEDLYCFIDYSSIPQKNVNLRLQAINTLGLISSLTPYFCVIAPTSEHKDTKKAVDKASYARRGWCRLEQWGHMCVQGLDGMYFFNGATGKLEDLNDTSAHGGFDWMKDSICVFAGEYTNPENRPEMVDVVLGMYGMVIQKKESSTATLYQLIEESFNTVFPSEYFGDLPKLLEEMISASDLEIKKTITTHKHLSTDNIISRKLSREATAGFNKPLVV